MFTFKHLFAFLVSRFYSTMATASISNSMLRCVRRVTGISVTDQSAFRTAHCFFFQFKLSGKLFFAGAQVCQDLIRLTDQLPSKPCTALSSEGRRKAFLGGPGANPRITCRP
jgi:hypothetical protein